ncbi:hypothetical protein BSP10_235 [Bacillus phage BSP10]|nr:hypothetical protein BSP10_235 [Bacillus phage BSP10]AYJ75561.1 hypothetical protein BSP21_226 [Bacillus phage BSP21]QRI44781.1 hypothetical protein BSTP3_236 [Bacillus phage BSTP3]
MATSTLYSHIYDAIQLQSKWDNAYLVFGKTSPWTDEDNPPQEDPNAAAIQEIVGYKKVRQFSLARPLEQGEQPTDTPYPVVTYNQQQWVLIPVDKAYTEKARWVYIEAEIQPDDFALGEYRQVGIHVDLKPANGVTKQNLLPSEVADPGILRFYENRKRQTRTSSVYALEQFLVKL